MVLGQILHLNDAACPSSGAIGTIELEHTPGAAIGANSSLHCLVFLHRGFGKLLTQGQNSLQFWGRGLQHFSHGFFAQGIRFQAIIRKPLLHLLDGVGVVQGGQFLHGMSQFGAGSTVHLNGLPHQFHIQPHTPIIDLLIQVVLVPYAVRHRKFRKPSLDSHFGFHITDIVFFESQPLIRGMGRKVAGTLTVGFRGRTGLTKILDEFFAFSQLLLFQTQHGTDAFQGKRQSHCGSPDHGAFPRVRSKVFFMPCITWTMISSSKFGVRYSPVG